MLYTLTVCLAFLLFHVIAEADFKPRHNRGSYNFGVNRVHLKFLLLVILDSSGYQDESKLLVT